jgi:hypothetical protein
MISLKPFTLGGFEPVIFCSGGGRDDHYATLPGPGSGWFTGWQFLDCAFDKT